MGVVGDKGLYVCMYLPASMSEYHAARTSPSVRMSACLPVCMYKQPRPALVLSFSLIKRISDRYQVSIYPHPLSIQHVAFQLKSSQSSLLLLPYIPVVYIVMIIIIKEDKKKKIKAETNRVLTSIRTRTTPLLTPS